MNSTMNAMMNALAGKGGDDDGRRTTDDGRQTADDGDGDYDCNDNEGRL